MKKVLVIFGCVFFGVMSWKIGEKIAAESFVLIIGVFLGVLAAIPSSLFVLAASRRRENVDRAYPVQQQQYPSMIFMGGDPGGQNLPPVQQQPLLPANVSSKRGEIEHANW